MPDQTLTNLIHSNNPDRNYARLILPSPLCGFILLPFLNQMALIFNLKKRGEEDFSDKKEPWKICGFWVCFPGFCGCLAPKPPRNRKGNRARPASCLETAAVLNNDCYILPTRPPLAPHSGKKCLIFYHIQEKVKF